ncbi:S41 family peptidase [Anaerocolumna jejuensis]|uniref:S41 family peptidase n=1 Tax=Anaerocolumna jejuensis TaxID=259063 RepID=UPI003F7C700F
MEDKDIIQELSSLYCLKANLNCDNLPMFVYAQNDKYFDILDRKPIFNIFHILNMKYIVNNDGDFMLHIDDKSKTIIGKIISINNLKPEYGLSTYAKEYNLILEINNSKRKITLTYPEIYQKDKLDKENIKMLVNRSNELFWQLDDFSEINQEIIKRINNQDVYIDLRNNRGGNLRDMVSLLSLFLKKNELMFCLKKENVIYEVRARSSQICIPRKIYILINNTTASSAEFFSAVLIKYCSAQTIGTTSEGKWIAHKVVEYKKYFIKIPSFNFCLDENDINQYKSGIVPDVFRIDDEINLLIKNKFKNDVK